MTEKRKIMRIKDIPVVKPKFGGFIKWDEHAKFAEPTGKGELLCVDGFFGRMFRSEEGCVRDELDEYVRSYNEMCQMLNEDPAHQYYEVLNYNDLYSLLGILPSVAGDQWGYTNSEDYRVDLGFDVVMVTEGEWVDKLGEPYLYFEPAEGSGPDPCYLEV